MSKSGTLLSCPCGKSFKNSSALRQHTRDSPRHVQQPVLHPPANLVVPVARPVQEPQPESPLPMANIPAGVKCPCGKLVKDEDGLMQHTRDSPRHRKLEVACIADENKASHQIPDEGVVRNCRRDSISPHPVEENGLRHRPVTFIGAGVTTGVEQETGNKAGGTAKKKESKKTRQSYGAYSSGTETRRSYRIWSDGTGQYHSDVGDNHALCDKDCGWCGYCMDNVDIWWDD